MWLDDWNASLALWYLRLRCELLFVGGAGTTEDRRTRAGSCIALNSTPGSAAKHTATG